MNPFINVPVKITDNRIKHFLLRTRSIFQKAAQTEHKAKDCLSALSFIEQDKPFDSFLAVRLLGQLPDDSFLYKDLLKHLNAQLKTRGVEIVDLGMAIVILPIGIRF